MHMRIFSRRIFPICLAFAVTMTSALTHAQPTLSGNNEFLPPDEAFRMAVARTALGFTASWEIADQYYLYRDKIKIRSERGEIVSQLPPGEMIKDEFFGETSVFRHFVQVLFKPAFAPDDALVAVTYQGCADAGLCYSPVTKQINLSRVAFADASVSGAASKAQAPPTGEQFRILERLQNANLLVIIVAFLGFGLLLALTPCILPMIPILSGIITSGGKDISSGKAFALSLSYVLAMAVTYSLFGVAIGLTGEFLQVWFQNPWVIGTFAAVFVLLALSMFGFYSLHMPSSVQTWLSHRSHRATDGYPALGSAAVMGSLSALIVGPCTTAPLIGALLFIAQTGDALVGGVALFSLAFGMGIPLLLVGTTLGKLLPQPGPVLDAVKGVFGLLMLFVAVWLLERVIPAPVILLLSGALLVFTAAYLYQIIKRNPLSFYTAALTQSLAVVILLYGLMLIVGGTTGGSKLTHPLEHFVAMPGTVPVQKHALNFRPVGSLQEFQRELGRAQQQGQPVMLDFYADWCVACKELEAFTFSDDRVKTTLANVVLLQADVTLGNDADTELLKYFKLFGPPAILFFDTNGYEFETARVVGYMNADAFLSHLKQVFNTQRA